MPLNPPCRLNNAEFKAAHHVGIIAFSLSATAVWLFPMEPGNASQSKFLTLPGLGTLSEDPERVNKGRMEDRDRGRCKMKESYRQMVRLRGAPYVDERHSLAP